MKEHRRRSWWVYALVVVAVCLGAIGWLVASWLGKAKPIPPEKIVRVERGNIARSVVAVGRILPLSKVEVKSKANGILQALSVDVGDKVAQARDAAARPGLEQCCEFSAPMAGYQEQVFYHDLQPDTQGMVTVRLVNPAFGGGRGLQVGLRYARADYPILVQWKMMGEGMYVVGLEPSNCHVEGRVRERERGTLVMLAPGETRHYRLEIEFA